MQVLIAATSYSSQEFKTFKTHYGDLDKVKNNIFMSLIYCICMDNFFKTFV